MRIFTHFNSTPVGTGFDHKIGKYVDIEYNKGDLVVGQIMDIKGKYLNKQFENGDVGVCIPKNIIEQM